MYTPLCQNDSLFPFSTFLRNSQVHFRAKRGTPCSLGVPLPSRIKCYIKSWLASRVSPSERIKEPLVSTSQGYYSTNLLTQEVSQQLRSSMLICMGLLGIHPLESQYKVTVGNVARPDFLNCHDSCDFKRLILSSGHPTGLAVRPSDVAL